MSAQSVNEACHHDGYCPLKEGACVKEDFRAVCRLKSVPLSELQLLAKVKAQIERLRVRG